MGTDSRRVGGKYKEGEGNHEADITFACLHVMLLLSGSILDLNNSSLFKLRRGTSIGRSCMSVGWSVLSFVIFEKLKIFWKIQNFWKMTKILKNSKILENSKILKIQNNWLIEKFWKILKLWKIQEFWKIQNCEKF